MMTGYGLGMWWMWLFGLLAVAGLLILIYVIVRVTVGGITVKDGAAESPAAIGTEYIGSENIGTENRESARQILDERYARGELTTEEYRERLAVLGEDR